ncbi:alpha/beta fold hydrolase [Microtetraspora sp. NBRC 16547]|uniref:alpha/beta fold hydrolase n=1 Tax=Microtetraspora sp. NBRC 16547 TaxID=3030993 RepID=UPI0024A5A6A2|nr:alpha/beta fold hydrolase [Microtetraspora sp. NBRC 16547]GLW99389.1 alpha/beta hydrolase [Microtetraspora sp. NBRC 16547]
MTTDPSGSLRASDGTTLTYRVVGSGPVTVTALHSLALDGTWFEPLAHALGADYRLVLPDLRGHGGSGSGPMPMSLATMADDVVALWDHLGIESSAVIGLSMGGMVAQALASAAPDRVDALVLIATGGSFTESAREGTRARIAAVRAPGGLAAMADDLMVRWFGDGPDVQRSLVDRARAQFVATDPHVHAAVLEAMTDVGLFTMDGLTAPALVIASRDDASSPLPVSQELASGLHHSRLQVLPGTHLAALTEPGTYAEAIAAFLDENRRCMSSAASRGAAATSAREAATTQPTEKR